MKMYHWVYIVGVLFMTGCASKVPFVRSQFVPAAEAQATVDHDDNGNAEIQLYVRHLARPENLTPAKTIYVVWAETPKGRAFNLGGLVVDDDLNGEFRSITPLTEFRLLITAEEKPTVREPSSQIVLRTKMFSAD
jgi:hypothetical protein